jgi:hypothetical protein
MAKLFRCKTIAKSWAKFEIKARIGKFTLFELFYDHNKKHFRVILFNLGVAFDDCWLSKGIDGLVGWIKSVYAKVMFNGKVQQG